MFMLNSNYMLIIYGLTNLIDQLLIGGFRTTKVRLNTPPPHTHTPISGFIEKISKQSGVDESKEKDNYKSILECVF